ncbi:MAG: serine protease [Solirubrobacterales bacterium]|nr:serine protease [Solirubrobacterales bacterium]
MTTFGLVLLVLGTALAVAEVHVVSHGILGAAAVAALAAGITLLVDGAGGDLTLAIATGLATVLVGGAYVALVVGRVLAARRTPVRGGPAGLIGRRGELRTAPAPLGCVLVDGALWRARLWEHDDHLVPGDPIVVEHVDGLTLTVRRAEEWELLS